MGSPPIDLRFYIEDFVCYGAVSLLCVISVLLRSLGKDRERTVALLTINEHTLE